jgi:hypothetical protein
MPIMTSAVSRIQNPPTACCRIASIVRECKSFRIPCQPRLSPSSRRKSGIASPKAGLAETLRCACSDLMFRRRGYITMGLLRRHPVTPRSRNYLDGDSRGQIVQVAPQSSAVGLQTNYAAWKQSSMSKKVRFPERFVRPYPSGHTRRNHPQSPNEKGSRYPGRVPRRIGVSRCHRSLAKTTNAILSDYLRPNLRTLLEMSWPMHGFGYRHIFSLAGSSEGPEVPKNVINRSQRNN